MATITIDVSNCPCCAGSSSNFCPIDPDSVVPDVLSNAVSYFHGGADIPAGTYKVTYIAGAFNKGAGNWVGHAFPGSLIHYSDGTTAAPGLTTSFGSFAAAEAANVGLFAVFVHNGGPIGVSTEDTDYTDNSGGTPSPTYELDCA